MKLSGVTESVSDIFLSMGTFFSVLAMILLAVAFFTIARQGSIAVGLPIFMASIAMFFMPTIMISIIGNPENDVNITPTVIVAAKEVKNEVDFNWKKVTEEENWNQDLNNVDSRKIDLNAF